MKEDIVIDMEFRRLLMPLSADEYRQLEQNVFQFGCLDPLKVWNGRLIDGHNRWEICQKHGIDFRLERIDLTDREAAHNWIINNQLGRRNITSEQASYLRGKRYQSEKLSIGRPGPKIAQNGPISSTAERLADEYKVSRNTIKRDAEFASAVDTIGSSVGDDARLEILSGDTKLTKQEIVQVARLEPERQREALEQSRTPHVAQNSGNNEWYTPPVYISAAREVMGEIDLDPATSEIANRTVKAAQIFTAADNGLSHAWHGNVWMNPPYAGELIGQFAAKITRHVQAGDVPQAIVLVNNATETGWFQQMAEVAAAICFPKTRVRFLNPAGEPVGAPLQGQAVLYFGDNVEQFNRSFSAFGFIAEVRR